MNNYYVAMYLKETGKFLGTVAGLGRNRNTWDANHSKRTANKYARLLNRDNSLNNRYIYKVEPL